MIATIYIESEVADHPRTWEILRRFPDVPRVRCERYGEIFNRKAQDFRIQKRNPSLILARKYGNLVLDAPQGFGIGGQDNFYFSHMLNCVYDCRYCFLQGMYRSAHYVLFVNYEDFAQAIGAKMRELGSRNAYFFSGYDCDSLALEPVTRFVEHFLPMFETQTDAWLELRTKSTQIRGLLARNPIENCIVAFTVSPESVVSTLEHKTASLSARLEAAVRLQSAGWPIGLRFDPVFHYRDFQQDYERLFERVFALLDPATIHSVSLGALRMPRAFFKTAQRLYPDEPLFASALADADGMVSYDPQVTAAVLDFCRSRILDYIPAERLFSCTDDFQALPGKPKADNREIAFK